MGLFDDIFGDPAKKEKLKSAKEISEARKQHQTRGVSIDADKRGARQKAALEAAQTEQGKHLEKVKAKERFREQCYLVTKMTELAKMNRENSYKKFTSIVQDDPTTTMNQLLFHKKMGRFMEIKNHQIAYLVPLIKFSLVEWSGNIQHRTKVREKQFRFQGTHMDLEQLLADPASRGRNLGIKSFSWDMLGTDPYTSPRAITAQMTLFGDSLRVFEDSMNDRLLRVAHPGVNMEYKAVLGWSVSSNSGGIIEDDLREAIEEARVVLLLTYNMHEFKFEQDGSFTLTINYNGRIESALGEVNIVGPASAAEATVEIEESYKKDVYSKFNKEVLSTVPEGGALYQEQVQNFLARLHPNDTEKQKKAEKIIREKLKKARSVKGGSATLSAAFEDMTIKELQKQAKSRRSERYSRIIKKLEELGGEGGRVYNLRVSREELDAYFSKYGGFTSKKMPIHPKPPEKEDSEKEPEKPKETARAPKPKPKPTPTQQSAAAYSRSILLEKMIEQPKSESKALTIPFIFFGDLVEALMEITDHQIKSRRIQFVLGSMNYLNRFTGRQEIISMADIPISLRRFSAWFHNNYVKKMSNKVPFNTFLSKVVVELIKPAFGAECFGDLGILATDAPNRVGLHTVTSHSALPKGRQTLKSLRGKFHNTGKRLNGESVKYNYVVFASSMDSTPLSGGDAMKDLKKGIVHLALGADRGMLKVANFSKSTIPGRRESLMMTDKGGPMDKANEPYQVDLVMIGNPVMRPGTQFYLTPTIAGSAGGAIAKKLGLGGYYTSMNVVSTITPGGYETSLRARFESQASHQVRKKRSGSAVEKPAKSLSDSPVKKPAK